MKRVLLLFLCFLLAFAVSSCAPSTSGENGNSDLPDPASFRQQDRQERFLELADRYYYVYNYKVYFSEKDNPAFFILCNKPECKHNDSNCNAYAESALGYWDEHLYGAVLLEGEPRIFRMNLDGTEHTTIADLEQPVNPAGTAGGFYHFYVHNGYMYYEVSNEGMNTLFRTEMATGKTERLFEDLLHGETQFSGALQIDGQKLYFVLRDKDVRSLYCADVATLELKRIRDWTLDNRGWAVYGNMLYYYASDRKVFCEYDLTTGEEKTIPQSDYYDGAPTYDSDYVYFKTWDDEDLGNMGLVILDRNYQFIQRIEMPRDMNFMYDAQDKLIFTTLPSQKATKYLPKSAIGTGETERLPIEDPYSYR